MSGVCYNMKDWVDFEYEHNQGRITGRAYKNNGRIPPTMQFKCFQEIKASGGKKKYLGIRDGWIENNFLQLQTKSGVINIKLY